MKNIKTHPPHYIPTQRPKAAHIKAKAAIDYEAFFLSELRRWGVLSGVGDDAVVLVSNLACAKQLKHPKFAHITLDSNTFVLACDGFCEGVHFKREWLTLKDIAYKAMLVNISDILAMCATPRYALLSITLPPLSLSQIQEIASALARAARDFGIIFIGGDTMRASTLSFHITMLGIPHAKILSRKGLKKGDLLYCTGSVGSSLYALSWLQKGGKIRHSRRFARFIAPQLRGRFLARICPFTHCGLDVSDGVCQELIRLGSLHRLGFKLANPKRMRSYMSGEEYEMLFSIAPSDRLKLLRRAGAMRISLEYIGRAVRGGERLRARIWHG